MWFNTSQGSTLMRMYAVTGQTFNIDSSEVSSTDSLPLMNEERDCL